MISKKRWRILISLIGIDMTVLAIVASIVEGPSSFFEWILYVLLSLLLIELFALFHYSARCPYCHRRGLRLRWKATDAGYCHYCGKHVEYLEYVDE